MFTKKVFISSLSIMFALSGISVVQAQNTGEQKTNSDISELLTLDENNSEFLKTLMKDGYAELGRYKVEKIKDNVYHWDEGTKKLPGGATDENGAMNNPSSMYFVLSEDGVVLVDLGNGSQNEEDIQNAKTIVESMTGDKHLSIIITHSHGDHTGFGRSKEVFSNVTVDNVYVSDADYDVAFEAISQFDGKITKVHSGETVDIYGAPYEFNVVNAHTEGSLMITDETHEALFTGDTFGSGFIWALFETNGGNPLAALDKGCSLARKILNNNPSLSILAGHRWQQFWEDNAQRPNEMSIQYFNDMAQVISGLLDGTTISNSYTAASWAPDAVELSSNGAKAKIDTLPKYIEAYKKAVNQMQEAYVYSGSDQLSIESVNAAAAPTFVVYPDGNMSDEEAEKYIEASGIKEIVNRSASKVYVARPANGVEFTSDDVQGFEAIVGKIGVSSNFKLIGIGNGATFINQNLASYMNFVSGLALVNPEKGMDVNVSVPTYLVTDNDEIVNTYVKANSATKTEDGYYVNPESHYEVVAVNKDTGLDAVSATKDAWEKVLKKFGRIGNYSDVYKETATWYSRPLISGNKEADQARKYQYFDSVDAIDNIDRYVNTQDLDNDGIDSLWYEYIPEQSKDAKEGSVPAVVLFHVNTNDPRTQYDTSGWAQIASEEGVILICPEWQGHTYQGYTYDPMTDDLNATADSDVITMLKLTEEKYPQIDQSRVYISGLSAGSMNTTNAGLSDSKYFAAAAGHSGPFGASELNKKAVAENKDKYDMPIIYFTGDGDEYCKGAFDTTESNGGLQVAQLYQELNDMEVTQLEDVLEADAYLYGVPWTKRYTIEPTAENIAKIDVGAMENAKGVEISMARIYGWGHWNYTPDAKLMWEFMSKYARDVNTGETIRLDKQTPETPTNPDQKPSDSNEPTKTPAKNDTVTSTTTNVKTGDSTQVMPLAVFACLSALAFILVVKKSKKNN